MSMRVHGHDVMRMMLELGGGFSREGLEAAILARFGAEARFHTCAADGMTASELIDFLEARGKFVPVEGGFTTAPDRICDH